MFTLILIVISIGSGERFEGSPAPQPESYSTRAQCESAGESWKASIANSMPTTTERLDRYGKKVYPIERITWSYGESKFECKRP